MAVKEVYSFKSADQVSNIHGVKWTPDDGQVKAVLQITHGMVEYIERYEEFAEFLTERGFAVMGHDHIGHGDSVSSEAEWGIMHTKSPSDTMVEDIFTNFKHVKEEYPNVPYFILGHSMGSYMLRKYLSVKGSELKDVNGAIVMGTGTEANAAIAVGKMALNVIAAFKGWDYRSKFVAGLMYGAPYKDFSTDGSIPEKSWLSKNLDSVKKYYSDPKCTYMFSLNGYKALLDATSYDNDMENIKKMNMDIPVIFVSGAQDPVGGLSVGVEAARKKFEDAGVKDLSMKLYEGDRHEILNELDRETIYQDLYDWMMARM